VPPLQAHLKQAVVSHILCTARKPFYKNRQLHSNFQVPWLKLQLTQGVWQPAMVMRASLVQLQLFHMPLLLLELTSTELAGTQGVPFWNTKLLSLIHIRNIDSGI
jgi:hypothetical protein